MACIEKCVVRDVVAVDEATSCADAARLMGECGIGSVGVRRAGRLVGLVTERDLLATVVQRGTLEKTTVAEAMRADQPSVGPEATDRECARLMRRGRTRHLAVRQGGEVVGVVSMLDLVDLVVVEKQWDIDQLESYIRGGRSRQLSEPIVTIFSHQRVAM